MLLLTGAWLALRRDKYITAGVYIGLATAIKLFPGMLVFLLILQRRWRCAIVAVITAGFLLVLSFLAVGWEQTIIYVTKVLPAINQQQYRNDSFTIQTSLLLLTHNVILAQYISIILRLIICGIIILVVVKFELQPERVLSLGTIALLWMIPVIWSHYFVIFYLPWIDGFLRAQGYMRFTIMLSFILVAMVTLVYSTSAEMLPFVQFTPVLGTLLLLDIHLQQALRRN